MDEPMGVPTLTKDEAERLVKRRETLLAVIADSYSRMATNTSMIYRRNQMAKCDEWLRELTEIYSRDPVLFNISAFQMDQLVE